MTTQPSVSSDETEWCTWCAADVIVDGYYHFECMMPVGHSGPHRNRLSLPEQSDPGHNRW